MRVFFNEDWTHFWYTRYESGEPVNEETLKTFIRQYEGTGITDFALNVNGAISSSESKVLETWSDKYEKKEENGVPVDYTNTHAKLHYEVFRKKKLDAYRIWIEQLKETGIRPWLSFRMNDCHNDLEKAHVVKAAYKEQHPEQWICKNRPAIGYFDRCLNYLLPEVRERMLTYIEEQLSRYDVDGIELDFTREPFCFPAGGQEEGRLVMTEFAGQVRKLVDSCAAARAKKIEIALLCQANPISAYNNGFDVATIAAKGYVDVVIASPRWATINLDIPIAIWKSMLGNKVQVGCMQQLLVSGYPFSKINLASTIDMAFGQAAAFAGRGADVIYLYNMFDSLAKIEESFEHPTSIRNPENTRKILEIIGDQDRVLRQTRRCPLTYDDFVNLFEVCAVRLPVKVGPGEGASFRVVTGPILPEQKAYLLMEMKEPIDPETVTVYVNSRKAFYVSESKADRQIVKENDYAFVFTPHAGTEVIVELLSETGCQIEYAEVLIEKE